MKTPKSISERRRSIRLDLEVPFRLGHQGVEADVVTINISRHGLYFCIGRDIPMMTKLDLGIVLPKSKKVIHAKGIIVRKEKNPQTGEFLIGAYFSDMKPADQKTLEKFIQSRVQS